MCTQSAGYYLNPLTEIANPSPEVSAAVSAAVEYSSQTANVFVGKKHQQHHSPPKKNPPNTLTFIAYFRL